MSSTAPVDSRGSRWIVLCFLIVGLPLILAVRLIGAAWTADLERRQRNVVAGLDRVLQIADAQCDTVESLERTLSRTLPQAVHFPGRRRAVLENLRRRFPGTLEFVVLDGRGVVDAELSDGKPSRALWQRFFTTYSRYRAGEGGDEWRAARPTFQGLLGALVDLGVSSRDLTGRLLPGRRGRKRADVFMTPPAADGMIVAFVTRGADFGALSIRDWFRRVDGRLGAMRILAFDRSGPGAIGASSRHDLGSIALASDAARVRAWVFNNPGFAVATERHLWAHREPAGVVQLLAYCRRPAESPAVVHRFALALAAAALFGLVLLSVRRLIASGLAARASLRLKLSGLLVFSAAVPLGLLALLVAQVGLGYRDQREREIHAEHERALRVIDAGFVRAPVQLKRRVSRLLNQPPRAGESRLAATRRRLLRLKAELGAQVEILDIKGRLLLRTDPTLRDLLDSLRFLLIDSLRMAVPADRASATQNAAQVSRRIVSRGFSEVQEYPLPEGRLVLMLDQLTDNAGAGPFLAAVGWRRSQLEERFLRQGLLTWQRQFGGVDFVAWHRSDPVRRVPRRGRLDRLFHDFSPSLLGPGTQAVGRVSARGQTWFLTGLRGLRLEEYLLMAVSNDREIRREVVLGQAGAAMLSFLAVAVSMLVGGVVARQFLRPLAALAEGVDALERRDFAGRVRVLATDELGQLADAFNAAVAGLGDLDVARTLQENLLPVGPLRGPRVEVFGRCVPAAQVGGDYIDYFSAPTGETIITVGDVSGHGMAPSLVVAMAKAVVHHPNSPVTNAGALLSRLSQVLADGVGYRMMMTFLVAVIDADARAMHLAKAGQCGPLLVRGQIGTDLKGKPALPLGGGRARTYGTFDVALQPGDQLVFYSDGLVEAEDRFGQPLGYGWIEREAPPALADDVVASEAAIRRRQFAVVGPQLHADDISVVVARIRP